MHIFSAAVAAYNRAFFEKENEKLKLVDSKGLHLIVGTDKSGEPISVPIVGALYDALDFFGITGLEEHYDNWISGSDGEKEVKKAAKELGLAPLNKLIQSFHPFAKHGAEQLSGKSFFSDVFNPMPIRDRKEHLARFFMLGKEYRYLTGKPMREEAMGMHWLYDLFLRTTNVDERAYYHVKSIVGEFKGFGSFSNPDNKETVLRREAKAHYGTAIRYKRKDQAKYWQKVYLENGGTEKSLATSMRNKHPLHRLSKDEKRDVEQILKGKKPKTEFGKRLTKADKQKIKMALEYYQNTFSPKKTNKIKYLINR